MDIEIIAEGLRFPEGPIALDDGSVVLVEIARGTLTRVSNGKVEVLVDIGGGPNGAALGPDGAIYLCNNGGRFDFIEREGLLFPGPRPPAHQGGSIQRVDLRTGSIETLYEACDGRRLQAPNDLVFDHTGGFWFTDHGTGAHDGGLFYARPDGSRITRWKDNQISPNGVGLAPDEKTVYFADTGPHCVRAYALSAPGVFSDAQSGAGDVFATLPDTCRVDSLAVDAEGRVCVATLGRGGIAICGADGAIEHIDCPDMMTTNICFGGADMRTAYVTLSSTGKLGKAQWPSAGLRLNFQV